MSYRKSDILALGANRHASPEGNLIVSFNSKPGSCDMLVLREVLSLFDAQIVATGIGYTGSKGNVGTNRHMTGYVTDLKFAELAKLNLADSFPRMEERRIAAEKSERERLNRLEARRLAEQEIANRKRQAAEAEQRASLEAAAKEERIRQEAENQKVAQRRAEAEKRQRAHEAEVKRLADEKEKELNDVTEELLQRTQ